MILAIGLAFAQSTTDCVTDIDQDLNCNYIDVSAELPVDETDEECQVDDDDVYYNADWYYDYFSFGCTYFLVPNDYDVDEDGHAGFIFKRSSHEPPQTMNWDLPNSFLLNGVSSRPPLMGCHVIVAGMKKNADIVMPPQTVQEYSDPSLNAFLSP